MNSNQFSQFQDYTFYDQVSGIPLGQCTQEYTGGRNVFNNVLPSIGMGFKSPLRSLASNWTRRRWLDFRNGHSIYLIFLMTFANFVTIQYGLLIDRVPFLSNLFGSIWVFAIIYVCLYVPIAMVIGYWHRMTQWRVEQHALFKENVSCSVIQVQDRRH